MTDETRDEIRRWLKHCGYADVQLRTDTELLQALWQEAEKEMDLSLPECPECGLTRPHTHQM